MTDPPCQTPSVMSPTARTLSSGGVLDRARRNSPRQSRPGTGLWSPGYGAARVGEGLSDKAGRRCSAGRRIGSGQPPAQHKSIAGGCLLPGARCHSAGQEPESRDEGVSLFSGNGSHLAGVDAAEGLAGGVPPGVDENGRVGRLDFGKGKARAALSARKCHQRYMAICPV